MAYNFYLPFLYPQSEQQNSLDFNFERNFYNFFKRSFLRRRKIHFERDNSKWIFLCKIVNYI